MYFLDCFDQEDKEPELDINLLCHFFTADSHTCYIDNPNMDSSQNAQEDIENSVQEDMTLLAYQDVEEDTYTLENLYLYLYINCLKNEEKNTFEAEVLNEKNADLESKGVETFGHAENEQEIAYSKENKASDRAFDLSTHTYCLDFYLSISVKHFS